MLAKLKKQVCITVISLMILVVGLFLVSTQKVSAAEDFRYEASSQLSATVGAQGANYPNYMDPRLVVAGIIRFVLGFIGTAFMAYTVYAGFKLATSRGDEQKIEVAKNTLRTAIIGIFVVLSAYGLTLLASQLFKIAGWGDKASVQDLDAVDTFSSIWNWDEPVQQDPNTYYENRVPVDRDFHNDRINDPYGRL